MHSKDLPLECSFLDFSSDSDEDSPASSMEEEEPVDNQLFLKKFVTPAKTRKCQKIYYTKTQDLAMESPDMDCQSISLADIVIQPGSSGSWLTHSNSKTTQKKHRPPSIITSFSVDYDDPCLRLERKQISRQYSDRNSFNRTSSSTEVVPHSAPIFKIVVEPEAPQAHRPYSQLSFSEQSSPQGKFLSENYKVYPKESSRSRFSASLSASRIRDSTFLTRSLPASFTALISKGKTRLSVRSKRLGNYSSDESNEKGSKESCERDNNADNSSFVLIVDQPKPDNASATSELRWSSGEKEHSISKESGDLSTASDSNTDYKDFEQKLEVSEKFSKDQEGGRPKSQIREIKGENPANETAKRELVLNWITRTTSDDQPSPT